MSNVAGQATAFMAITPIHSGEEATLRRYLDALPQRGSPLERLNGTHFARWVILTDSVNDLGQGREDHLDSAYLIFTRSRVPPADDPASRTRSVGDLHDLPQAAPGRATTSAISTSTPTVGDARSARTSGAPTHATHSGGPASMEPVCSASATASSVAERPTPSR
jgi:hypothetical protein